MKASTPPKDVGCGAADVPIDCHVLSCTADLHRLYQSSLPNIGIRAESACRPPTPPKDVGCGAAYVPIDGQVLPMSC